MKILPGYRNTIYGIVRSGEWFCVFKNEDEAMKWSWLFLRIFRRNLYCYGGFFNAWRIW